MVLAGATFAGAIYGTEQAILPGLDVAPPITRWTAQEIGIDAGHHLVALAATGLACRLLTPAKAA